MEKTKRKSGIELLRIIGMFIICFSHCRRVFHFEDFQGVAYILNYISWGNIGNLIFIIISNYFLADSKEFKLSKIKSIIIDQFIISMFVTFITIFICKKQMNFMTLLKQVLIVFYGGNWFITTWLFYYLIHPLLNIVIEKLSKKEFTNFVVSLVVFYGFLMIIPANAIPKEPILDFIVLHFVVSYCKKYYDNILEDKIGNIKFLITSIAVFLISIQCLMCFAKISNYDFWNSGGYRTFPPMVIMVFSMLYIFKKMTFYNPFINKLGSLCLLNYMIHENYYFKKYGADLLLGKLDNVSYLDRYGYLLLFTVVYFIIGFILAFIYGELKSRIVKILVKK